MSETASISTGIAARYASAVFDIAKDGKALAALESDIDSLDAAMGESADMRALIASPLYSRDEQSGAMAAIAKMMHLSATTSNVLGLLAAKRRLFVLPYLLKSLRLRLSAEKGEVAADVITAQPMTKAQTEALAKTLKAKVGKDVKINATVDESLIGGLIVNVGSKMIDTSIRSRLAALQNTMKEVG